VTQAIPEDQPARTSASILPPMAPPQPSWKDREKAEGDKPEAGTSKTAQPEAAQPEANKPEAGGEEGKE
jgi:hypothetical protein